jgi:carbonic anhydrase
MYKHPLIDRDKMSPQEALDLLREGNQRFINNISANKDMLHVANLTKDKQHPFAAILSCSDSRTATELIFDQNLGDIFSVRLAGNIASDIAIGSLEYACKHLGSKLVVVLGHSSCGGVKAACEPSAGGNIGEITKLIEPAVSREKTCTHDRSSSNSDFVAKVCQHNVEVQLQRIYDRSPILREMLANKQIGLVGGVYDLSTAIVTFPEDNIILDADKLNSTCLNITE